MLERAADHRMLVVDMGAKGVSFHTSCANRTQHGATVNANVGGAYRHERP